jgi:hypothetical protein
MTNASRTMHIKVGFAHFANSTTVRYRVDLNALIKRFRLSLVSAPSAYSVCDPLSARNPRYVVMLLSCITDTRYQRNLQTRVRR